MYSANLPNTNMTGTKTATSSVVIRMQITIRSMLHAMHLNLNLTAEVTQPKNTRHRGLQKWDLYRQSKGGLI